ncbi:MAG: tetraacyldisaccharide 4'-kinase [Desulfobulbaceae bacterium]|nr:tetraacyldisaccharide 4'-kinase [Desulfobulbaceae bacterium]
MSDKRTINPNPPRFSFIFGRPFAPLYGWVMSLRAAWYKKGRFKSRKLGVPVVSVGNLTMGGTGKTPMVMYLAKLFADRKVAIVSRGYSSKGKGDINLVANGHELLLDVEQAGDEPYLMAESLPGVVVATGKDRALVGDYCAHELGCDLILLDDGFQHLKLQRDLDIVLFKVDSFLGNNRVFPGGDMREPLAALQRADCFVLTCVSEEKQAKAEAIKVALQGRFPDVPVFFAGYSPVSLKDGLGAELKIENCSGMKVAAFCGLAQPFYFRESLADAGLDVKLFKSFADHHRYTQGQVDSIVARAKKMQLAALVVTEKDFVKLADCSCGLPLYKLQMDVQMEPAFAAFILASVGK